MPPGDMTRQRILVIGTSCAGKTTFARRVGSILQAPVVELDELHWAENWQEKPDEQFVQLVREATSAPAWIADGNYSVVRDVLWPQATVVIWLNYGLLRVLWRGLRRSLRRSLTREGLWHGNHESLRRTFLSRDSILLWIITTHGRRRIEFAELRRSGAYPQLEWIEFSDPKAAERWLRELDLRPGNLPARCGKSG
jgi:adenylate kinase family enzyme